VLDTFNRANGAPGANWGGATSNFQIASNQLDVVSAGDTGPLLWSPTSFGATQQACVKLAAIDGNADDIALVLKAQSNTGLGNGLMEVLYDPTPGAIRIWTYVIFHPLGVVVQVIRSASAIEPIRSIVGAALADEQTGHPEPGHGAGDDSDQDELNQAAQPRADRQPKA